MDHVKRQLAFDQPKEDTKRLRNSFNLSKTSIENLSNEIFYEIFDYLNNSDIYEAFSNLNYRFQQLINSPYFLFKIKMKLNYSTYNQFYTNNYRQFLLLNKHRIFSMNLCLGYGSNNFFSLFTIDSSLSRLQSLFIELQQSNILISLLMNLACLPRLFSLTIEPWNVTENINDIYQLIFTLPVLKSCSLIFNTKQELISLPMATNQTRSTIEYLSIYHSYTFNELSTILSYTPKLRRLNLFSNIDLDISNQTIMPIAPSHLKDISMSITHAKFNEFEIFIGKIYAHLKVLRVSVQSHDTDFLIADRWEQLISQSLPQLEKFSLKYSERIVHGYKYPLYPDGPNQFTSPFWIGRRWIFEVQIIDDSISYLIHSYRKRWYEYTDNTNFNFSVDYCKSTRLTMTYTYPDDFNKFTWIDSTWVSTIGHIYHLEISQAVHISVLIGIVNLLSELTTLKLRSLSSYEPKMLNATELIALSSIEDMSKITKVHLEKMYAIEELDFLLELCPHVTYLKVEYIKHTDFKFVLRYILKKIKDNSYNELRLLCFRIPLADDEMIKQLKRMIHFEKLLCNHTIKRAADNIYLERK